MPKFNPSDDGKVVDGKTVVFVYPPGAEDGEGAAGGKGTAPAEQDGGTARKRKKSNEKGTVAAAQAKTLKSAAKNAVPFCEECEKAHKAQKAAG